jgi:hypothetical protein
MPGPNREVNRFFQIWCENCVPDLLTIAIKSKQKNHRTGFYRLRVALRC